ncbi:MAG: small multi-drug export protein [Clostridia bacterium]|nr:small multi-drug export protein [Clostridia bacterium]
MLKYLILFGMSMVPILELRGSLIFAAASEIPFYLALPIAVIGNMIPVPFILFLFEWALKFFSRRRWIGPLLQRFWKKAEEKAATLGKYELLGVYLFVAIPIPGTGAWMGSLVATVLKLDRRRAMLAILAGVVTAGLIVSALFYLLPDVFSALFS